MKNKILILSIIVLPLLIYAVLSFIDTRNRALLPTEEAVWASPDYVDRVTIYKFYSPMCADCSKQTQEMSKIDEKYAKYVLIEDINVSNEKHKGKYTQEYIDKFDIVSVPTLVFADSDNKIIRKYVGFVPVDKIHEGIEANKW